jgi:hypothetical protein
VRRINKEFEYISMLSHSAKKEENDLPYLEAVNKTCIRNSEIHSYFFENKK